MRLSPATQHSTQTTHTSYSCISVTRDGVRLMGTLLVADFSFEACVTRRDQTPAWCTSEEEVPEGIHVALAGASRPLWVWCRDKWAALPCIARAPTTKAMISQR